MGQTELRIERGRMRAFNSVFFEFPHNTLRVSMTTWSRQLGLYRQK